jgi:hypothetical protein
VTASERRGALAPAVRVSSWPGHETVLQAPQSLISLVTASERCGALAKAFRN